MNSEHDRLLDLAFNSWSTQSVAPFQRTQYWRGTNTLNGPSLQDDTGPGCVVPIEYAKLALAERDEPRLTALLNRVSAFQQSLGAKLSSYESATRHMAKALSAIAAAGVYYQMQNFRDSSEQIKTAVKVYDKLWRISQQTIGQATAPGIAGNAFAPSHFDDQATQAMETAQQNGAFGNQGCSVSTWLAVYFTLRYLFEPNDLFAEDPGCKLKMLLADTSRNTGHVAPVHFQSVDLPKTTLVHSGIFLDSRALGITIPAFVEVKKNGAKVRKPEPSLRTSLWLAWRCCRQSLQVSDNKSTVIRIQVDLPDQYGELTGGSAGGLFAVGMYAASQRNRTNLLDATCTTTCRLAISSEALKKDPQRIGDETQPLYPHEVMLESVGSVPAKIDQAWQRQHQLDTFLLHPRDADLWKAKRGTSMYPQIRAVNSLEKLLQGFRTKDHEEYALENLANYVHGAWDRAVAAVHSDNPHNRERDHRLDCYVSPSFRVEGFVAVRAKNSPLERKQQFGDADNAGFEMVEAIVPKSLDDDDLLNLLALSICGQPWPGQPNWVRPNRHLVIYDNAGAGKSVCSLRLRYLLTAPDPTIRQRIYGHRYHPLVVHIEGYWPREHLDGGRLLDLREVLERFYATEMLRTDPADRDYVKRVVDHALKNNRVVFIADGLDQFDDADRKHLAKVFNERGDADHCRWIIAGRVHAIEESKIDRLFDDRWLRVRIEPFTTEQQDEYFNKPITKPIGNRWTSMIDREAMAELLKLPVVLSMLRTLIEGTPAGTSLPVFESLSQLYLITSRQMLALALKKNLVNVQSKLTNEQWHAFENLAIVPAEKEALQLELLEHILSLFAFQLMLLQNRNARVVGSYNVRELHEICEKRYFYESDQQAQLTLPIREQMKQQNVIKGKQNLWEIAVKVLHTIEFSHRGLTEAMNTAVLALRSRKVMECMAARYLTRYATKYDVFGDDPNTCWDLQTLGPSAGLKLAAVDFVTAPDWKEVWELAINMPHQPLRVSADMIYEDSVISDKTTCRSLSVLFQQPKPYPGREVRPTELIYRAWHLFEYDEPLLRERKFLRDGVWVTGEQIITQHGLEELQRLGNALLLGEQEPVNAERLVVKNQRLKVIEQFRSTSRPMVDEFELRRDKILIDANANRRESISADETIRKEQLAAWAQQSSYEKSHTFLQCPPAGWLKAYEKGKLSQDPRINPAIEQHETVAFKPMLMQASTVTRCQYRQFDPAFESWQEVSDRIKRYAAAFGNHTSDDDFPIICTDWFDSWVFAKWLGPHFCLPTEWHWEHAARAGTTTKYHFGDGCNGSQANCDGNYPYGDGPGGQKLAKPPYLERTTPVGCADYPCSPWGLWDVHGNVWEWCESFYEDGGSFRVYRGGCWHDAARYCRSANRDWNSPDFRDFCLGFRVSLVPSSKQVRESSRL